jgi:hypothetical protein
VHSVKLAGDYSWGLCGLTNERDFPVPSDQRPVRVAVNGN